jgi:SPP1 family predicted phage head-tail adaptor
MARNQKITLYRPQAGTDTAGRPSTELVKHRDAWADLRLLNGMQTIKADAAAAVVRGSARIRFCTDLADDMVVEYGGVRYKITAILPDQRKARVDLALEGIK